MVSNGSTQTQPVARITRAPIRHNRSRARPPAGAGTPFVQAVLPDEGTCGEARFIHAGAASQAYAGGIHQFESARGGTCSFTRHASSPGPDDQHQGGICAPVIR